MAKSYPKYIENTGWETRAMEGAYAGGMGKKQAAKENHKFRNDCEEEGVEPTGRQYGKWTNKTNRWKNK